MQKKILIILGVIIVLVAALYFATNYKSEQAAVDKDNPYGKDNLDQATIDQLDNPNYQNQMVPKELDEKLSDGDDMVVYFYDPTCPHCQKLTPRLVPIAQDMGVDMKKLNLLEFRDGWDTYDIDSTPTLVYYEDGEEVDRINGPQPDDMYRQFFKEYVVNDTGETD
ncbi:thioredoxin family protein [Barrientosiimonas marina]|uniref:Thioredoxin family protein n=1 Tax=Lentibacillus kimchii TaxID=1542911 RepID=A0ABW2UW02_9BACI